MAGINTQKMDSVLICEVCRWPIAHLGLSSNDKATQRQLAFGTLLQKKCGEEVRWLEAWTKEFCCMGVGCNPIGFKHAPIITFWFQCEQEAKESNEECFVGGSGEEKNRSFEKMKVMAWVKETGGIWLRIMRCLENGFQGFGQRAIPSICCPYIIWAL